MRLVKEPEWVLQSLNNKHVQLIDCQFSLSDECLGKEKYMESHIPGAVFMDVVRDLSGPVLTHGGRHPLPSKKDFVDKMKAVGINDQTVIIAYDGGEGAFAGRFTWLAHLYGYEQAYVLNGGLNEWLKRGYPVDKDIPKVTSTNYEPPKNMDILASYSDVKKWTESERYGYLIDSREAKRYKGIHEPIDHKAGHIPGAINMVWTDNFSNGVYLSIEELEQRFQQINKNEPIILYCGSGITATPNYIALKEAGFTNVKIYAGSFSDWISYPDNGVETDH